jgi:uncharacterized protein YecE (DUF72 family)
MRYAELLHWLRGLGLQDWIGDLFPIGSKSGDFLALYSRRLTTVEGNTTFYETNLFYLPLLP